MSFERRLKLSRPLALRQTLADLRQGANDPCVTYQRDRVWWASRTPAGPATICLSLVTPDELHARAWGDGAELMIERVPQIVGEHQRDHEFETDHELVGRLHREFPGLRIPKTFNVWEMAFAVVLAQRVTGGEAVRSYQRITRRLSEPAPGPTTGMMLPVDARVIASLPYYWFHPFGVERKRAMALKACAQHATKLDALVDLDTTDALRHMLRMPGLGPWTAASVALVSLGHADAVPVGDYHFADHVAWALAKEVRGTDERMLELLAPFAGQRGRVLRLLLLGCSSAPKFGPRYSPTPIASI